MTVTCVIGMREYDSFMPRGKPFARIAITLPADDLAAVDRLASAQDRSRSWTIAEAVRWYVASLDIVSGHPVLDASRREQLTRDLDLSPTERVRAAEEGRQVSECARASKHAPLRFQHFDAFRAWMEEQPAAQ